MTAVQSSGSQLLHVQLRGWRHPPAVLRDRERQHHSDADARRTRAHQPRHYGRRRLRRMQRISGDRLLRLRRMGRQRELECPAGVEPYGLEHQQRPHDERRHLDAHRDHHTDKTTPSVKIAMTLENNTLATRKACLVRYADVDAGNWVSNNVDGTANIAFAWGSTTENSMAGTDA
jgi:hypothetical protein